MGTGDKDKKRLDAALKKFDGRRPAMPKDPDFATPGGGGCWFCYRKDEALVFDIEWDTFVHKKCIRIALELDPVHPEAELMRYLLND